MRLKFFISSLYAMLQSPYLFNVSISTFAFRIFSYPIILGATFGGKLFCLFSKLGLQLLKALQCALQIFKVACHTYKPAVCRFRVTKRTVFLRSFCLTGESYSILVKNPPVNASGKMNIFSPIAN